jgi:quercetin dioxygenase-like cupin family protein
MELSERCIETLEKEGFISVYEWQDKPGTIYPEHSHIDKVTMFVTEGSVDFTIAGTTHTLRSGDRFDVPPSVPHSAVAGPQGCQYVIGEMIDGDS